MGHNCGVRLVHLIHLFLMGVGLQEEGTPRLLVIARPLGHFYFVPILLISFPFPC